MGKDFQMKVNSSYLILLGLMFFTAYFISSCAQKPTPKYTETAKVPDAVVTAEISRAYIDDEHRQLWALYDKKKSEWEKIQDPTLKIKNITETLLPVVKELQEDFSNRYKDVQSAFEDEFRAAALEQVQLQADNGKPYSASNISICNELGYSKVPGIKTGNTGPGKIYCANLNYKYGFLTPYGDDSTHVTESLLKEPGIEFKSTSLLKFSFPNNKGLKFITAGIITGHKYASEDWLKIQKDNSLKLSKKAKPKKTTAVYAIFQDGPFFYKYVWPTYGKSK
jgi:hypothetical protein